MGLLDGFMGGLAPVQAAFQQNPYAITALGMGLLSGRGTSDAFAQGLQGLLSGSQMDTANKDKAAQKAAIEALFKPPAPSWRPGGKTAVAPPSPYPQNMRALATAFPAQFVASTFANLNPTTDDIKEYNIAKQQGYTGTFVDYVTKVKGASQAQENAFGTFTPLYDNKTNAMIGGFTTTNRGTVIQYKVNPSTGAMEYAGESRVPSIPAGTTQGKPQPMPQGGASGGSPTPSAPQGWSVAGGSAPPSAIPPSIGYRPAGSSVKIVNQGTSQGIITGGGQPVGSLPVDVQGEASQRAVGGIAGTSQQALPLVENVARRVEEGIDALLNDKGLESLIGIYAPFNIPKTSLPPPNGDVQRDQARVDSRIKQVVGNTFMAAYEQLKGAGAITEGEGQAAKEAFTRLTNTAMHIDDYKQALLDAKREMQKLVEVVRRKAAGGGTTAPVAPAAGGSSVDDLIKKYAP